MISYLEIFTWGFGLPLPLSSSISKISLWKALPIHFLHSSWFLVSQGHLHYPEHSLVPVPSVQGTLVPQWMLVVIKYFFFFFWLILRGELLLRGWALVPQETNWILHPLIALLGSSVWNEQPGFYIKQVLDTLFNIPHLKHRITHVTN